MSGAGRSDKARRRRAHAERCKHLRGGHDDRAGTLLGDTTSLEGDIANEGVLVFSQTADDTFAGVISGTGSVQKRGAGVLTLTGASNYAGGTLVSAGTLLGDTTSLQGDVTNDAALVFDQAADGTFAGTVRAPGRWRSAVRPP